MVDATKRGILLDLIRSQTEYVKGRALVTPAEFFDGNDDLGSIGCNLSEHPGLNHFHEVLKKIEALPDVDELWMQIYDIEESDWPFSENILIFGDLEPENIQKLCESLQPSEVTGMQMDWVPSRANHLKGRKYVNLWWD
jgi:hypothetical protein